MRFFTSTRFWAFVLFGPFALAWLAFALLNAVTPIYGDHVEPTVVNAAEQWLHGRPLYHPVDGPYMYQMLYAPFDFLWVAFVLKLCANPILAGQIAGTIWSLADIALLLVLFRRVGGIALAIAGVGLVGAQILAVPMLPFWDRPDPIIFFAVGLSLFALELRGHIAAGVLLAISLALAIDCKLHAFLYLIPAFAVWWKRHGFWSCIVVAAIGGAVGLIPFLLPGISLKNYAGLMHLIAHQPMRRAILFQNIEALVLLFVPLAVVAARLELKSDRRQLADGTVLSVALVAAGLITCIPAAKDGAGPHHLLPFAIVVGYLFCRALAKLPARGEITWATCLVVLWVLFALTKFSEAAWDFNWHIHGPDKLVQADLRQLLEKYPSRDVQMGVGGDGTYENTFYSPWIYRDGSPRVFDPASYMDMNVLGVAPTQSTDSLEKEEFRYWLIPAGDAPFSLTSYYEPKPLFNDSVEKLFAQHYTKIDTTKYFDVYQAKGSSP